MTIDSIFDYLSELNCDSQVILAQPPKKGRQLTNELKKDI